MPIGRRSRPDRDRGRELGEVRATGKAGLVVDGRDDEQQAGIGLIGNAGPEHGEYDLYVEPAIGARCGRKTRHAQSEQEHHGEPPQALPAARIAGASAMVEPKQGAIGKNEPRSILPPMQTRKDRGGQPAAFAAAHRKLVVERARPAKNSAVNARMASAATSRDRVTSAIELFRELGQQGEQVAHQTIVGDGEDRRGRVGIDGDDDLAVLHAGEVLDGA